MANQVRIIGGVWRSRLLHFADAPGLRPTPSRVRETLFNWLQFDIIGCRCLDLFAGSGALGFEAASRGAKRVVMVEQNPQVYSCLATNAAKLSATQVQLVNLDASCYLQTPAEPFDLVFLDPPFATDWIAQSSLGLETYGWLGSQAKIYLETASQSPLNGLPENWRLLKGKVAGEVAYRLYGRG